MAVGETPGQGRKSGSKLKFVRISSGKNDEMSSFCLVSDCRKQPFYHVSRDKILHDLWSFSAVLARGFSARHFERGEGPGDEVGSILRSTKGI